MTRDPRMTDPHAGGRVAEAGTPPSRASGAVVALHGRGGSPEDMLGLAAHLALPDLVFVTPEAAGRSWWPQSFLAPLEADEPGLSSASGVVTDLVARIEAEGMARDRIAVMGFSQGGCPALERAARTGGPLRAVIGLSAGLIGTAEADGPPIHGHAPKRLDYGAGGSIACRRWSRSTSAIRTPRSSGRWTAATSWTQWGPRPRSSCIPAPDTASRRTTCAPSGGC